LCGDNNNNVALTSSSKRYKNFLFFVFVFVPEKADHHNIFQHHADHNEDEGLACNGVVVPLLLGRREKNRI
jgi:hypothetical protein